MFCPLSGRSLSWNTLVFSRFTSREHANFIECHFFHTQKRHVLIPHHSKAQLLRYCGKRSLLGVGKSWKLTLDPVPWFGRHVKNFGDVIIYPVLVVARTSQQNHFFNMASQPGRRFVWRDLVWSAFFYASFFLTARGMLNLTSNSSAYFCFYLNSL